MCKDVERLYQGFLKVFGGGAQPRLGGALYMAINAIIVRAAKDHDKFQSILPSCSMSPSYRKNTTYEFSSSFYSV